MAHFAELDDNNVVIQVIVGINEEYGDGEIIYQQETGRVWKKTSYNTRNGIHVNGGIPFRKNYAGIGYTYDSERDAFIPPKPYASWILNEDTCVWDAPTPMPTDGQFYQWVEDDLNWQVVPTE